MNNFVWAHGAENLQSQPVRGPARPGPSVLLLGPLSLRKSRKPSTSSSGWRRDVEVEDRWKTGRTGIPLVDATMRELVATGYRRAPGSHPTH